MTLRVTILGCGSSGGVPRIGGDWGVCDPGNPKNRRQRCSILVERVTAKDRTTVLVDTTPDMRNQLLAAGVGTLDGVLYTHEHADHIHGIDDLRAISYARRARIDIYGDERTLDKLRRRFGYCFSTPAGSSYPPIVSPTAITPFVPVTIKGPGGDIAALPFTQHHGDLDSLGFRFGGLAYSSDVKDIPPESVECLQDLDVWIVDALRPSEHPTHFSLDDALGWIERLRPRRAVLTNMHIDLDYETLRRTLPGPVEPAYDGMRIDLG